MSEDDDVAEGAEGLKGSRARAEAHDHSRANSPRLAAPIRYDSRYPAQIPFDRTDRRNLRYRRRSSGPWVAGLVTWLLLELFLAVPLALGILWAGGVPPHASSDDETYFGWVGSAEKGRSGAIAALFLLSVVAAIAGVWAGARSASERRTALLIDRDRIHHGVRAVQVPAEVDPRHDWFGRRRRRAIAETPMPRADHHEPHEHGRAEPREPRGFTGP